MEKSLTNYFLEVSIRLKNHYQKLNTDERVIFQLALIKLINHYLDQNLLTSHLIDPEKQITEILTKFKFELSKPCSLITSRFYGSFINLIDDLITN